MAGTSGDSNNIKFGYGVPWREGDDLRVPKDPRIGFVAQQREVFYRDLSMSRAETEEDIAMWDDLGISEKRFRKMMKEFDEEEKAAIARAKKYMGENWKPREPRDHITEIMEKAFAEDEKIGEQQILRDIDLKVAQRCLDSFNSTNGTDYILVEVLGSQKTQVYGSLFHCNFRAKRKGSDDDDSHLFFDELHDLYYKWEVLTCCDLTATGVPTVRGCKICGPEFVHPRDGFQAGK